MKGLNVSLKNVCSKSLFDGVILPNHGPCISHLFCVDNAIFVGEWDSLLDLYAQESLLNDSSNNM